MRKKGFVLAGVASLSAAVVGLVAISSFGGPKWELETQRTDEGVLIFTPHKSLHPGHYNFAEMVSIFSKLDTLSFVKMAIKDSVRNVLGDSSAIDVGDERLETYYDNFEQNFDSIARVGSQAPDFEIVTTEGDVFRLSDQLGKPVAFMFVSITCPPAVMQRDAWATLSQKYDKDDVTLAMVYSIEQHPGEPGYRDFKHPANFSEKMSYAKLFGEETDITVAVDSFERSAYDQYDELPNPVYIVDKNGFIVFKSVWSDAKKVEAVLDVLLYADKAMQTNESTAR